MADTVCCRSKINLFRPTKLRLWCQDVVKNTGHALSLVIPVLFPHSTVSLTMICDAIKQNESEVEKYDFWFFGIFY